MHANSANMLSLRRGFCTFNSASLGTLIGGSSHLPSSVFGSVLKSSSPRSVNSFVRLSLEPFLGMQYRNKPIASSSYNKLAITQGSLVPYSRYCAKSVVRHSSPCNN